MSESLDKLSEEIPVLPDIDCQATDRKAVADVGADRIARTARAALRINEQYTQLQKASEPVKRLAKEPLKPSLLHSTG